MITMKQIKFLSGLGFMFLIIAGCAKSTFKQQEQEMIDTYIKSLGDTAYVLKPSGLYYIELDPGSGRSPVVNDTVSFWYNGMFTDRVSFNSNYTATPFIAIIGYASKDPTSAYGIIPGLDEGLKYMKEGGKGRFLIPSSLAYGQAGIWGIIPGYTPLVFEVELNSVKSGSKK